MGTWTRYIHGLPKRAPDPRQRSMDTTRQEEKKMKKMRPQVDEGEECAFSPSIVPCLDLRFSRFECGVLTPV
jgi:hypothetical protein